MNAIIKLDTSTLIDRLMSFSMLFEKFNIKIVNQIFKKYVKKVLFKHKFQLETEFILFTLFLSY